MGAIFPWSSGEIHSPNLRDSVYTEHSSYEMESFESPKFNSYKDLNSTIDEADLGLEIKLDFLVIGPSGAGKTSLIRRYVNNQFESKHIQTYHSRASKFLEIRGSASVQRFLDPDISKKYSWFIF